MSSKKCLIANRVFVSVVALLFATSFLTQKLYSMTNRYASLLAFAALFALFIAYTDMKSIWKKRDVEFFIMCITDVLALLFLFLIQSHKGAILTVVNLMFVLYLSNKVKFTKQQFFALTLCGGLSFLPWFGLVKLEYNHNMVGLVFLIITILGLLLFEHYKEEGKQKYLCSVQFLLYMTGLLFMILYHARCAIAGILVFGVLYLLTPWMNRRKWTIPVLAFLMTIGSVLFTYLYTILGRLGMNLVILYKDIFSGREEIWKELWTAFLQSPVTGIGSAYEMKSFFLFEVHNGLFDILVVHGIVVFTAVLWLLIRRLLACSLKGEISLLQRIAFSGVYAILFTSFFENFFIVPPYLLIFFVLLTLITSENPFTCTNEGNLV